MKIKNYSRENFEWITAALIIGLAILGTIFVGVHNRREAASKSPVEWQSAAWIMQPDGSRIQFGIRADGTVVWRKLPEEKSP